MSLDVYLKLAGAQNASSQQPAGPRIFVRENGQTKEISRQEWDERYPGREPVTCDFPPNDTVYRGNITHNLSQMARAAGLYEFLWRADDIGVKRAKELIEPLRSGLARLTAKPEFFKTFNPENGWGDYEGLVRFTREYLAACEQYREAEVSVSR